MSGARMVMVITTLAASAALVAGATAAGQAGGGYKILGKFGQTGTGNGQFATASNGIAILMLFGMGWTLGTHTGRSGWRPGVVMVVFGLVLVAVTIALGG